MNHLKDTTTPNVELDKLAEIAVLAGISAQRDETTGSLVTDFEFGNGRQQRVFARPIGTGDDAVVSVFSPAATYPKSFFGGLRTKDAKALLRLNSALRFARFAVAEDERRFVVIASMDLLLKTMDPDELGSALESVSVAADKWEQYAGQGDQF